MKFRRNPLPRSLLEITACLTLFIIVLAVSIYDMTVVMPAIHKPGGVIYIITVIIFIFLVLNTLGNVMACMIIDTSVDQELVEVPSATDASRPDWRFCSICDRWAPPRSWHCKYCGICILKRDHHCQFTGCCIGHQNHRYFIFFLLYLFISSVYALAYNTYYLVGILTSWLDLLIPLVNQFVHLPIWAINVFSLIVLVSLLTYHLPIVVHGTVSARRGKQNKYNCGVYSNLRSVFGKQMYIAWICPLIKSKLPENGYTWKICPVRE